MKLILSVCLLSAAVAHYHIHDWNAMEDGLKLRGIMGKLGMKDSCELPEILSYHIHVIFWYTNPERVKMAMDLRQRFMERFDLGTPEDNCTMRPGDPAPGHDMCVFKPHTKAIQNGPFLQGDFAIFIPPALLQETSAWMLQHRGILDVFIHPNSGCEVNDHTKWNTYAGVKWPIDTTILTCNYPGCKPGH